MIRKDVFSRQKDKYEVFQTPCRKSFSEMIAYMPKVVGKTLGKSRWMFALCCFSSNSLYLIKYLVKHSTIHVLACDILLYIVQQLPQQKQTCFTVRKLGFILKVNSWYFSCLHKQCFLPKFGYFGFLQVRPSFQHFRDYKNTFKLFE